MPKTTHHKYKHLPLVLAILDGWGITSPNKGNAVTLAKTPIMDALWQNYAHTQIAAHGVAVGLPAGQDGNSEAGHMNLGAGRVVEQDTVLISKAISNGRFFKNSALKAVVEHVQKNDSAVHLMGLLTGWQSAHADPDHVLALLTYLRLNKIKKVYLHLFTDGRDSYKYGALQFFKKLKSQLRNWERVVSVSGRYYAMDRKKKWHRTERVYDMLVMGQASYMAESFEKAIEQAYSRGETDEFIQPTIIVDEQKKPTAQIKQGDAIVFFNLRSDRTRQLTKTFVQNDFNQKNEGSFKRKRVIGDLLFVAMTDFGPDLDNVLTAFPSADVKDSLPMVLSDLRQLYIAENEKYAHVTYFFNGGYSDPVGSEERIQVPSVDVASYDLKPEMSAMEITKIVIEQLKTNSKDFICLNFANPDMVGHTGNLAAGIRAVEIVDGCLGLIFEQTKLLGWTLVVTADHGNVEEMIDLKTGEIDTQHSAYPVPFIIANHRVGFKFRDNGILGDVAPTILDLINKDKPINMTGESLVLKQDKVCK